MSIIIAISNLSLVSGLFPVFAAIYNYRWLDATLKIVAVFFLVSLLADIIQKMVLYMGVHNNSPIIHVFIAASILFFGAIYHQAFHERFLKNTTVILCAIAMLITIYFGWLDIMAYPAESNTASSIVFLILSLLYFYQIISRSEFVHIEKQGMFWINAGVLFYYAIDIFPFMLFRQMAKEHAGQFYTIHAIANILSNILFSVGLLCKPQRATTKA